MSDFSSSKLAKLLSLLSAEECKHFTKWLNSPWCNSNKALPDFFQLLLKFYPDFNKPRCNKEYLYQQIYPDKPYESKPMRHLMAELAKQVEQFLIQQQLQKEPFQQKLLLQEAFLQRHQTAWFEKLAQQNIADLKAQPIQSWMDLLHLALLHEGLYFQPDTTVRHQPEQKVLHHANHYLDAFYALGKYRFAFEVEERKKIVQGDQETPIDLEYLQQLKQQIADPALEIFDQHLLAEHPLPLEKYYALKEKTLSQMDRLSTRNQRDFLIALINKASRLLMEGHKGMHQEILSLYEIGLQRDLLITKGKITNYTFNNIIVLNNLLKFHEQALRFSSQYHSYLSPEYRQDALKWAHAHTFYHSGDFHSAVDILVNHSFSTDVYDIQGRVLLLQSYFDLYFADHSYYQYLLDYSNAFEKFVQRNKYYSKFQKQGYFYFIRYARRLATLNDKEQLNKVSITNFYEILNLDKITHAKIWLIQKLNELDDKE